MKKVVFLLDGRRRILDVFFQLLDKKKIAKKDLMVMYGVSSSTIQRDMNIIEDLLLEYLQKDGFDIEEGDIINRKEKGYYHLDFTSIRAARYNLTDNEWMAILKILLASRALTKEEIEDVAQVLLSQTSRPTQIKKAVANELLYYAPVPKDNLFEKMSLIAQGIEEERLLLFCYQGSQSTQNLKRFPTSIYFSDHYFYMMTEEMEESGLSVAEKIQKFRIDKILSLKLLPERKKAGYKKQFEGGKVRRQTTTMSLGNEIQLVIEYYGNPEYVYDAFPDYKILKEEEGVTTISLNVNDGFGTKMWLLSQGELVKVLSPRSLQTYLVEQMEKTLRYYDD